MKIKCSAHSDSDYEEENYLVDMSSKATLRLCPGNPLFVIIEQPMS